MFCSVLCLRVWINTRYNTASSILTTAWHSTGFQKSLRVVLLFKRQWFVRKKKFWGRNSVKKENMFLAQSNLMFGIDWTCKGCTLWYPYILHKFEFALQRYKCYFRHVSLNVITETSLQKYRIDKSKTLLLFLFVFLRRKHTF